MESLSSTHSTLLHHHHHHHRTASSVAGGGGVAPRPSFLKINQLQPSNSSHSLVAPPLRLSALPNEEGGELNTFPALPSLPQVSLSNNSSLLIPFLPFYCV